VGATPVLYVDMEGKQVCRGEVGGRAEKMKAAAAGAGVLNELDVFANLPAQHNTTH